MRGSLFITGVAALLSRLVAGADPIKIDPALCESDAVEWLFTMGATANVIEYGSKITHEFLTRLQRTGGYINHRVTVGSYQDGEKSHCTELRIKRATLQSAKLQELKLLTPKKYSVADGWHLAGFDGMVRPLAVKNFMKPDAKKIVVYFYDTPSKVGDSTSMQIEMKNLEDACGGNWPTYDYMQEAFAQRNPTVIAVKIKHKDTIDHEDLVELEQKQFDELKKRGLKLYNIQFETSPDVTQAADYLFDIISKECSTSTSVADQLAVMQSIGGCRDSRDFVLVFPTSPYGLNWGMNIAETILRLANELGTHDAWHLSAISYTDAPGEDSKWGTCATLTLPNTQLRRYSFDIMRRTVTYDRDGDAQTSGLDAVYRAMSSKLTSRRSGVPAIVVYIHDTRSHVAGDTNKHPNKKKPIDDDFNKGLQTTVNYGCNDYQYVSVDNVVDVFEDRDIFVDVSVAPVVYDADIDLFNKIKHHTKGINAVRIDMPGYADQSSYDAFIRALSPFCYPR